MKVAATICFLALGATLLLPGQSPNQASHDKQWTIEGDVTTDAGPAAGAVVLISSGPPWWGRADAEGHYVVKGTSSGSLTLCAKKEGAAPSEPKTVTVFPGKRTDTLDFHLGKMSVISGRVLDANRKPVEGAYVSASVKVYRDGRMRLDTKGWATTDDLGQYRITDLGKGRYFLMIGARMLTPRKRLPEANRVNAPVKRVVNAGISFYPGVDSLDASSPITLAGGAEYSGADIVVPRADSFCVRTKVIPPAGEPKAALWLNRAIGDSFPSIARGMVVPGEELEICGVTPGQYWLEATTADPTGRRAASYVRTEVVVTDRDVDAGTLHPAPVVNVQGRVSVTGDSEHNSVPDGLTVTLTRRGRPLLGAENLNAPVHPDGAFTIAEVYPDQYGLSLSRLPDGYYLREARQQGIDVTYAPVWTGNGELFISLGSGAAVIGGTTVDKDDHPVPDAMVVLIAEKAPSEHSLRTQQSDQSGAFKFEGIVPGDYKVLALTNLFEGEAADPAFIATQMFSALELSAGQRSSNTVTLKVRNAH